MWEKKFWKRKFKSLRNSYKVLWASKCCLALLFCANDRPHSSQEYGFSPVWDRKCLSYKNFLWNHLLQKVHMYWGGDFFKTVDEDSKSRSASMSVLLALLEQLLLKLLLLLVDVEIKEGLLQVALLFRQTSATFSVVLGVKKLSEMSVTHPFSNEVGSDVIREENSASCLSQSFTWHVACGSKFK